MTEDEMIIGKELDKALYYVCDNLSKTGHNSKPVLLHSFKVAYRLLNYGYERDIVIAAALHDLIEDTDVTYNDIKNLYGEKIADIVDAVSFKKEIKDKYLQAKEMYNRCIKYGRKALIVKCSDLCDNIDFIYFAKKEDIHDLLRKYALFLDISKTFLKDEIVYKELLKKYQEIIIMNEDKEKNTN